MSAKVTVRRPTLCWSTRRAPLAAVCCFVQPWRWDCSRGNKNSGEDKVSTLQQPCKLSWMVSSNLDGSRSSVSVYFRRWKWTLMQGNNSFRRSGATRVWRILWLPQQIRCNDHWRRRDLPRRVVAANAWRRRNADPADQRRCCWRRGKIPALIIIYRRIAHNAVLGNNNAVCER